MNSQETDKNIRQLFSEQRIADTQRAPSFARVWQSAVVRREEPAPRAWGLPLVAVASGAIMLIAGVMLSNRDTKPQPAAPTTVVASINDWTSPTDFLLEPSIWSTSSGSQP